jgi:hypothetical protein
MVRRGHVRGVGLEQAVLYSDSTGLYTGKWVNINNQYKYIFVYETRTAEPKTAISGSNNGLNLNGGNLEMQRRK